MLLTLTRLTRESHLGSTAELQMDGKKSSAFVCSGPKAGDTQCMQEGSRHLLSLPPGTSRHRTHPKELAHQLNNFLSHELSKLKAPQFQV